MVRWREAYERVKGSRDFINNFKGATMSDFRFLAYSQQFTAVAAASTVGTYGTTSGPTLQTFPSGAIILGITATAIQAQTVTTAYQYAPSFSPGRRDLFGISLQYTNAEQITPNGLVQADALMGSGNDTIFPAKEILMNPSQGLLCGVASLTVAPTLSVTVVYHCMVLRAAN